MPQWIRVCLFLDFGALQGHEVTRSYSVVEYYKNLGSRRVMSDVEPGYLKPLLPSGPPQGGEKFEEIQKDIDQKIMPGLTHW